MKIKIYYVNGKTYTIRNIKSSLVDDKPTVYINNENPLKNMIM